MDLAEFFADRAALYQLLARLYMYPLTAEVLSLVAGLSIEQSLLEEYQSVYEGLTIMQKATVGIKDLSLLVDALNCEATRLFEGPGQPLAPPYGSYYLNGKRLMGPEAIAVREIYIASQMLPNAELHQPPDHLALELSFLAALAADPKTDTVYQMRHFIAEHIFPWFQVWKEDVLAVKPHPFFVGLVKFTQMTIDEDLAWLSEYDSMLSPDITGELER